MQITTNHADLLKEYGAHLTLAIEHERCLMMVRSSQLGIPKAVGTLLTEHHAEALMNSLHLFDEKCDELVNNQPTGVWKAMRRLQAAVNLQSMEVVITDAELSAIDILSDATAINLLADRYLVLVRNLNEVLQYVDEDEAWKHLPVLMDLHKNVTEYRRYLERVVELCVDPRLAKNQKKS